MLFMITNEGARVSSRMKPEWHTSRSKGVHEEEYNPTLRLIRDRRRSMYRSKADEDRCLAQRPTKIDVSLKTDVSFKIDKPDVSLETIIFELC